MLNKKIVFLASDGESSRWVYNALQKEFSFVRVIIESPVSKSFLFKRRMKKIGFFKVSGQALFSLLVVPFLKRKAQQRKKELVQEYQLNSSPFPADILRVASVNDPACEKALRDVNPDIVLVNGTRIISRKILSCTGAAFINMHVGITPAYRGSHGGYWAVYNNDMENFGTTIHLVDAGVDTGAVLKQVFAKPSQKDNFVTYPVIQVAIGINALKEVLRTVQGGNHKATEHTSKGKMYYQPTIWQYLRGR